MEWLNQYFEDKDNFPKPIWENIYEHVDTHFSASDQNELWCNIARKWMNKLKTVLLKEYDIYESDNLILVTSESEKYIFISKLSKA